MLNSGQVILKKSSNEDYSLESINLKSTECLKTFRWLLVSY